MDTCYCDANCHMFRDCCTDVPVDCQSARMWSTVAEMLNIITVSIIIQQIEPISYWQIKFSIIR